VLGKREGTRLSLSHLEEEGKEGVQLAGRFLGEQTPDDAAREATKKKKEKRRRGGGDFTRSIIIVGGRRKLQRSSGNARETHAELLDFERRGGRAKKFSLKLGKKKSFFKTSLRSKRLKRKGPPGEK